MPALREAITRYHRLVEQNGFADPAWCEELQDRMRKLHLTDSGRLISPVLRPHFVTRKQVDLLARVAEHFSTILDAVQVQVLTSPALLGRLQMLPVEKMLAAVPTGSPHLSTACRLDTILDKGGISLLGLDASQPSGLAYSDLLADLFLDLPIVKEFKRGGFKVSKLGAPRQLHRAILAAWKSFGGRAKPAIAVVEFAQPAGSAPTEGQLIAEALRAEGASVSVLSPEQLQYVDGRLEGGAGRIDVVFRQILTCEILTRWELTHPLLQAYRDGAVCVVNSFRSEMGRRRALLELLSDEAFVARFAAADRKLITSLVPWTRVLSARKTKHYDAVVDLLEYVRQAREELVLLPNEDDPQERIYVGADMTQSLWERAIKTALRTPYVVQERKCSMIEAFPLLQTGQLKVAEVEVILQPLLLNGELASMSALLRQSSGGHVSVLGIAPVLVVE